MNRTPKQPIIVFLPIMNCNPYVQSQYVEQIRAVVSYVHTSINPSACTLYIHTCNYIYTYNTHKPPSHMIYHQILDLKQREEIK